MDIRVYQGDTALNQTVTFNLEDTLKTRKSVGKIVGTIVNEVYCKARYYRKMNSRLFKGNEPVLMRITVKGQVIDFGDEATFEREIQSKFRIVLSEAGEKRYAKRVFDSVTEGLRKLEICEVDAEGNYKSA